MVGIGPAWWKRLKYTNSKIFPHKMLVLMNFDILAKDGARTRWR